MLNPIQDLIRRVCILDGKNLAQFEHLINKVDSSLFEIGDESNISKLREPACYRDQTGHEEFVSAVVSVT
jgi:hypothetical protein